MKITSKIWQFWCRKRMLRFCEPTQTPLFFRTSVNTPFYLPPLPLLLGTLIAYYFLLNQFLIKNVRTLPKLTSSILFHLFVIGNGYTNRNLVPRMAGDGGTFPSRERGYCLLLLAKRVSSIIRNARKRRSSVDSAAGTPTLGGQEGQLFLLHSSMGGRRAKNCSSYWTLSIPPIFWKGIFRHRGQFGS